MCPQHRGSPPAWWDRAQGLAQGENGPSECGLETQWLYRVHKQSESLILPMGTGGLRSQVDLAAEPRLQPKCLDLISESVPSDYTARKVREQVLWGEATDWSVSGMLSYLWRCPILRVFSSAQIKSDLRTCSAKWSSR